MLHLVYTRCVTSLPHIREKTPRRRWCWRSVSFSLQIWKKKLNFFGHFGIDNMLFFIRLSFFVWSTLSVLFLGKKRRNEWTTNNSIWRRLKHDFIRASHASRTLSRVLFQCTWNFPSSNRSSIVLSIFFYISTRRMGCGKQTCQRDVCVVNFIRMTNEILQCAIEYRRL